jgi:chromosome segregation ATPase|tara:strand:- start:104 stop:415 length:312 start_codon:yes stop_codon:yes gene_type:complete
MKIWKIVLGFFGLVGGLFALQSSKKKEVKELEKVIKENKKEEKKVEAEIKVLQEKKTVSKKQVGNLKRKLTNSKKKTKKMQEAYDNDDVESAEDFLSKFSKGK